MPTVRAIRSMFPSLTWPRGGSERRPSHTPPVLVLCTSRQGHPDVAARPTPDGAVTTCGGAALTADRFTHGSGRGR